MKPCVVGISPISDAVDVDKAVEDAAEAHTGQIVAMVTQEGCLAGHTSIIRREPLGVIAQFAPETTH